MKRTYNFGADQAASIDRIAVELHIDKTDVLTNGLRLLRLAMKASRDGAKLRIVYPDGNVETLVGPWNDVEPRPAA